LNRKTDAIKYLRQANEMNPWRTSVGKILEKLSGGKVRAVKPSRSQKASDLESCSDVDLNDCEGEESDAVPARKVAREDFLGYDPKEIAAAREAVFGYDPDDTDETFEEYLDTHGY
jgi:hypothetical protein